MERQKRSSEEKLQPLEPTGTQEFKNAGGDYNNNKVKKVNLKEFKNAQDAGADGTIPKEQGR